MRNTMAWTLAEVGENGELTLGTEKYDSKRLADQSADQAAKAHVGKGFRAVKAGCVHRYQEVLKTEKVEG